LTSEEKENIVQQILDFVASVWNAIIDGSFAITDEITQTLWDLIASAQNIGGIVGDSLLALLYELQNLIFGFTTTTTLAPLK
jgi:hypothetical protein